VSQPDGFDTVSTTEPAALNKWPSIVTGKLLAQTAVSIVAVRFGLDVTLIVLIVSHPDGLDTVSTTDPATLNRWPSIVTGKLLAQTAVSIVAVNAGTDVTLIVLMVSQPDGLDTVSTAEPAALNKWPSIVTGKLLAQTAVSIVAVRFGVDVTLIVLIVSHPDGLDTVSTTELAALNT